MSCNIWSHCMESKCRMVLTSSHECVRQRSLLCNRRRNERKRLLGIKGFFMWFSLSSCLEQMDSILYVPHLTYRKEALNSPPQIISLGHMAFWVLKEILFLKGKGTKHKPFETSHFLYQIWHFHYVLQFLFKLPARNMEGKDWSTAKKNTVL